jgi:hypothetical protein
MKMKVAPFRIDDGDFARCQGNHDRDANLYYEKYVIYSARSRLLLSLRHRTTITQATVVED